MAGQQLLRLLAPVAAEIGVQQIDHGPEMPAFLDIDLEQVAQVVERRRRMAQQPLLLDRSRLGVALGHDQTAQGRAMLARHLLPDRLAEIVTETDPALGVGIRQEDAPAVVGHADMAVGRPALGIDRGRSAQVDVVRLIVGRPEVLPPLEEFRLPMLERALQGAVRSQIHIVRNPVLVVDPHGHTLSKLNCALEPVPKTLSAPRSPVAFGRTNTQFCQADNRPKTLVHTVSAPAKRRLASSPVKASGDRLARSSSARRISSSQSRSSGASVTRPAANAGSAVSGLPSSASSFAILAGSPRNRVASRLMPLTIGSSPKLRPSSWISGGSSSPSGRASM